MISCRFRLVLSTLSLWTLTSALAASPVPPLEKDIARRIIAEYEGLRLIDINVGLLLSGESPSKGFAARHATKVVYIARRLEDGGRYRRRASEIVFHHDREYGWFLMEVQSTDLKDTIHVWSELCGCIRIE